jgi:hypothetical protein
MSRHGAPDNGALARGKHGRRQLDCSRLQGRLDTGRGYEQSFAVVAELDAVGKWRNTATAGALGTHPPGPS